ncbi:hypothetical protein [Pontixanthobacter sp. CEM42]|uniref:hypothetical protein n=1 Tax=Pontixanthobacter sp. CEM42 TaxID=2792077 RepID=UPI001ADF7B10|nr:hypothetical protein [Pontixanthobacter sp. CEM42]
MAAAISLWLTQDRLRDLLHSRHGIRPAPDNPWNDPFADLTKMLRSGSYRDLADKEIDRAFRKLRLNFWFAYACFGGFGAFAVFNAS